METGIKGTQVKKFQPTPERAVVLSKYVDQIMCAQLGAPHTILPSPITSHTGAR